MGVDVPKEIGQTHDLMERKVRLRALEQDDVQLKWRSEGRTGRFRQAITTKVTARQTLSEPRNDCQHDSAAPGNERAQQSCRRDER